MSIEEINVKIFIIRLLKEFSDTRYRPWSCVEEFLDDVKSGSKNRRYWLW